MDVPTWRATKDVTIKADIIEEITRIYGYDNFQIETTRSALYPEKRSPGNKADNFAKDILVQRYHLHEVHSYIWFDAKKCKDLGIQVGEKREAALSPKPGPGDPPHQHGSHPAELCKRKTSPFAPDFGIFEIGRVCEGTEGRRPVQRAEKAGHCPVQPHPRRKELYMELLEILTALGRDIKRADFTFQKCGAKARLAASPEHGLHLL